MADGRNIFDQPVRNDIRTYDNIEKLAQVNKLITQLVAYYIIHT